MASLKQDRASSNDAHSRGRGSATVIALGSSRSSSRHGEKSAAPSPRADATVIAFRPRRAALAGQSPKLGDASHQHPADGEDDYSRRMLINLLSAGWVGTVMTGGYYAFSALAQMP
jgi:hypothetical protein